MEALADPNCGWFYRRDADTFRQIPGSPIAYWASDTHMNCFASLRPIRDYAYGCNGMTTGDNDRFLRLWHEVSLTKTSCGTGTSEEAVASACKWFPYNKGGDFRKWYGNEDWVINWANNGEDAKTYGHLVPRSQSYMFKPEITWSKISSGKPAFRLKDAGHMFDVAGLCLFPNQEDQRLLLLGVCNSSVSNSFFNFLSPTLNFEVGNVCSLPYPESCGGIESAICETVSNCVKIGRDDYDSLETSWVFKRNPLV